MANPKPTQRPEWLQKLLRDQTPGPRIFAWTFANLAGNNGNNDKPAAAAGAASNVGSQRREEVRRRIYVLGVGNLGRLYASCLARLPGRPPITLVVHRRSLLEHWRADPGITITRSGVPERTGDFDIEWWTEEQPSIGPVRELAGAAVGGNDNSETGALISNLIVATKAPDAIPQVDRLRRYLGAESTVAFVQNGMSRLWPPYGTDYSAERWPPGCHPTWLLCVTMHGVFSEGAFRSVFASPADVKMGPVLPAGPRAEYLMGEIMRSPELAAERVGRARLLVLQLEKLVVNATINPMTALLRCRNGVLFEDPGGDIAKVLDLLLEEASAVLIRLVQDESTQEVLNDEDGSKSTVSRAELVERFSARRLREMLYAVGARVGANRSSMFQDVKAGKTTEIREINGWLVDTANYLDGGLDVPSHRTLVELIEAGVVLDVSQLGKYFPIQGRP